MDTKNLLHGLLALWPSYLAYAVTFLFIGQVWANHHVVFDHVYTADRVVLLLNILPLMAVAFLPFAISVLATSVRSGGNGRTAVVFYGVAFDLIALTFNAVWQYTARHKLHSQTLSPAGAQSISRRFQLALLWLAAGILIGAASGIAGLAIILFVPALCRLGRSSHTSGSAERVASRPRCPGRRSPTSPQPLNRAPGPKPQVDPPLSAEEGDFRKLLRPPCDFAL